jgi:hypothetical protein
VTSGGATPECAKSNDLAGRLTDLARALAEKYMSVQTKLLCFSNIVKKILKILSYQFDSLVLFQIISSATFDAIY